MNDDMYTSRIKPAFNQANVPVVMAADRNYLQYMRVALESLVRSSTSGNIDALLLTSGLDDESRRLLLSGLPSRPNLSVRLINLDDALHSIHLTKVDAKSTTGLVPHVSAASCWRLFLPELLPDYDKLIYIDVDVIVRQDIAPLYDFELGTDLLAGVIDLGIGVFPAKRPEYRAFAEHHGFNDWNHYVNAGVLLLNLAAMRRENLTASLFQLAQEASEFFFDQDALNFVCRGRVRFLSPEWNLMVQPSTLSKELRLISGKPAIYHFSGRKKPWIDPSIPFSYLWWAYASVDDGVARLREIFGVTGTTKIGDDIAASVVIPVYNAAEFLPQTMISYCAQTLENIEIICIDDGSTDGTREVCEKFASVDSRIKVISQKNQGAAIARNRGIEEAKGRWLFFAEADDFCMPQMLEEMVEEGEKKDSDVVAAAWNVVDFQSGRKWKQNLPPAYFKIDGNVNCHTQGIDIFLGMDLPLWNKLFKTSFIKANGIEFHQIPMADDCYFVTAAMIKAGNIAFLESAWHSYRVDNPASQLSDSQANKALEYIKNLKIAFLEVKGLLENEDERFKSLFYSACVANFMSVLFGCKTVQARLAVFDFLKHERIEELAHSQKIADECDLGESGTYLDMIRAGDDITDLLIERCRQEVAKCDARFMAEKAIAAKKAARLQQEVKELKASFAYRVGMFITWPARKFYRLIKGKNG